MRSRECQYLCSSFNCELCLDVINCETCYNSIYLLNCQKCVDSAFLYDCRNCNDCFLSSNLRNKQYYFANKQYSKEEYFKLKNEYNMKSRSVYEQLKTHFKTMMKEHSYHKALSHDMCENSSGDYLANCKDCEGCYFMQNGQDCANYIRPAKVTDSLDCVAGGVDSSLLHLCMGCYYNAFDCRYCSFCRQCSYIEYCMYCVQCEHCFGCVGLKNKKYHIFNKPYTETEYFMKKKELIDFMKNTGEYGDFSPLDMSAVPYNESWSSYYFPLDTNQQRFLGAWYADNLERENNNYLSKDAIPDTSENTKYEELMKNIYWDDISKRPFQIRKKDCIYADKMGVPLPYCYYIHRLQENFKWMPFDGTLKDAVCMDCKAHIKTSWSPEYHQNLLCDTCYDKRIG